jgi:hypothetical protein
MSATPPDEQGRDGQSDDQHPKGSSLPSFLPEENPKDDGFEVVVPIQAHR